MSDEAELQAALAALDPTTRTLIAEVDLGEQAKEFIASDIGAYIVGCCRQEIEDAQLLLKRTLPWRRHRIQELQNRIWRAESLLLWLRDLIAAGQSASKAVEESESHDD